MQVLDFYRVTAPPSNGIATALSTCPLQIPSEMCQSRGVWWSAASLLGSSACAVAIS